MFSATEDFGKNLAGSEASAATGTYAGLVRGGASPPGKRATRQPGTVSTKLQTIFFPFIFWCDEAKRLTRIATALSNESQIVSAEARGGASASAHILEGHF